MPDYPGLVNDIYLIRCADTIKDLVLTEDGANPKHPFLAIPETDPEIE